MYIHKVKWQKYIKKNIREMVLSWAKLIGQNLYHTIRWGWDWMGVGGYSKNKTNGMCTCTNTIHILNVT